jgi:hypothetical protein
MISRIGTFLIKFFQIGTKYGIIVKIGRIFEAFVIITVSDRSQENILKFYLLRRSNMSKKLFSEVLGIIFFVEDCSRQARILEMVKVIRARCTKVFVPVENNNVLARSQRKF